MGSQTFTHDCFALMMSYFHWPYDMRQGASHTCGLDGYVEQIGTIEDPVLVRENSDER
jgi:hypothetical protein